MALLRQPTRNILRHSRNPLGKGWPISRAMTSSTTAPSETRQLAMLTGPKSSSASAIKIKAPPQMAPTKNNLPTSNNVGRLMLEIMRAV